MSAVPLPVLVLAGIREAPVVCGFEEKDLTALLAGVALAATVFTPQELFFRHRILVF
jgi:hypothetical protein